MNLQTWSDVIEITLGVGAIAGAAYKGSVLADKILKHMGVHAKMATAAMLRLIALEKSVSDLATQLAAVEKAVSDHLGSKSDV
jgi:hypothetical protein